MEAPTLLTGTVKFYNVKAKFGFITDDASGQDYYVRKTGLIEQIEEGDRVEFSVEAHEKGPKAINVRKLVSDI